MVAHATFQIPEDVFKFMVVDDWFPLSGQEGHEKEGVLHLILRLLEIDWIGFYTHCGKNLLIVKRFNQI